MASEGRSYWLAVIPTLHSAVPPELHVLHGANAGYKSQNLLQPVRIEHATFGMPGQRPAWAATTAISSAAITDRYTINIILL